MGFGENDLTAAPVQQKPKASFGQDDLSEARVVSGPDLSIGTENTWSDVGRSVKELGKLVTGEYDPVEHPDVPELTQADVPVLDSIVPDLKMRLSRDPEGQANILAEHFQGDDRFGPVQKDANGHVMVTWNGKPYYLNKPGVSQQDVGDFISELVRALPVTKLTGLIGGPKTRMAANVLGYSANEGGRQAASGALGSGEEIDPLAMVTEGVMGAAGDAVAGKLGTRKPKAPPHETIPMTKGQKSGDITQLRREEAMRQGARGDAAEGTFRKFDDEQTRAIEAEAGNIQKKIGQGSGLTEDAIPNIGNDLQGSTITARDNAKAAVDKLYKEAREGGPLVMSGDGMKEFASRSRQALADFDIDGPGFEPVKRYLTRIEKMAKGKTVKDTDWTVIENLRKQINNSITKTADLPADRALMNLKGELDGFVDEALERGLLSGDESVLRTFQRARVEHSRYKQLFGSRMSPEPASKEMVKLLDEAQATPEQFINAIVGAGKTTSSAKARGLVQRMVEIFGPDSAEVGLLKDAFIAKAFTNKGQVTRASIINNVRDMFDVKAKFLSSELFTQEEIRAIKEYAKQVAKTITPDDARNPSRSGWVIAKDIYDKGLLSNLGKTVGIVPFSDGIRDALVETGGSMSARRAIKDLPALAKMPLRRAAAAVAAQRSPEAFSTDREARQ